MTEFQRETETLTLLNLLPFVCQVQSFIQKEASVRLSSANVTVAQLAFLGCDLYDH